jgi:hypothetical protein
VGKRLRVETPSTIGKRGGNFGEEEGMDDSVALRVEWRYPPMSTTVKVVVTSKLPRATKWTRLPSRVISAINFKFLGQVSCASKGFPFGNPKLIGLDPAKATRLVQPIIPLDMIRDTKAKQNISSELMQVFYISMAV